MNTKDKYELAQEEALQKLMECKARINNSCFKCDTFFTCNIRLDYVKKTYESMSKGSIGGFEF